MIFFVDDDDDIVSPFFQNRFSLTPATLSLASILKLLLLLLLLLKHSRFLVFTRAHSFII